MGKIQRPNNFSQLTDFGLFSRFVSYYLDAVAQQLTGNLTFVDNVQASGPTILGFTNGSHVIGITHGLGQVPQGFLVINQLSAASIFAASGQTWTSSIIYLQASAGVTATIYVI